MSNNNFSKTTTSDTIPNNIQTKQIKDLESFIANKHMETEFKKFKEEKTTIDKYMDKELYISGFYKPQKIKITKVIFDSYFKEWKLGFRDTWGEKYLYVYEIDNIKTNSTDQYFTELKSSWEHFVNKRKENVTDIKSKLVHAQKQLETAEKEIKELLDGKK